MEMMEMMYYYVSLINPFIIKSTDFLDELIWLLYIGEAEFISPAQIIELKLDSDYIDKLKKIISSYQNRVPLYDIQFNHIYLIYKENIYPRIFEDNYRFTDINFYNDLIKLKNPSKEEKNNLRILNHYNLEILEKTYFQIFYESFILTHYITSCRRPSFYSKMEHIMPYYKMDELYYLAYDWNLTNKKNLNEEEIRSLCKKISQFDIPAKILLDHQIYIYDQKAIGLVKHYSLFGSYFINRYLREYNCCSTDKSSTDKIIIKNLVLENQIKLMIQLIKNAPEFLKSYTVYRFIENDNYLKHLKIGDIYHDPSFISTTRDPVYYQENYQFGYILIKIKLPEKIKGVGLSIEAYSNFPKEEEIILPPTTKLRLDKIILEGQKENTHEQILNKAVKKKYEFTWIDNDYIHTNIIKINVPDVTEPPVPNVKLQDLLLDENIKYTSISERLNYFTRNYVNINYQFRSMIGQYEFIFILESYNSTSVYQPFFYYETSTGLLIYSSNPKYGNISIMLELGHEIHVNYYFRFSVTDSGHQLDLNTSEWIEWLSLLAYVIGSRTVIIHASYVLPYNKKFSIEEKQIKTRYTYSQDIYLYLKRKEKLFDKFREVVTPNFDYGELEKLFLIPTDNILKPTDRDDLYRLSKESGITNLGDFYVYLIEKFPKYLKIFEDKMDLIYESPEINPFANHHISYNLDPWNYLYNNNLIKFIPSDKEFTIKKGSFKTLIGNKKIPQFKNRLRYYLSQ